MAFLQVDFYAETLGMATGLNVILPEAAQGIGVEARGGGGPLPVLYLLHGLSDDQTIWMRRSSIERYAASRRLAVVMPCAGRSFYCNERYGSRYWDYISEELPRTVQGFFPVSRRREDTFVAGLSMGGYGAMKLALHHPERFAAAASFSGVLDIVEAVERRKALPAADNPFTAVFGPDPRLRGGDNDLLALLQTCPEPRPRLFVSCGTADFLYPHHQRFVGAARAAGWNLTAAEKAGAAHTWDFWDRQIQTALDWFFAPNT